MVNWNTVTEFENKIAQFFGATYAVAVDSCTHGLELCLRYKGVDTIYSPKHTYLSVPMLANKMGLKLVWKPEVWQKFYRVHTGIIDAATLWERNSYLPGQFMCLSFQYQKHLSLGRGGMVFCPDEPSYNQLKKMSYDGRLPGIPWREQDIKEFGFHYYMTPETAQKGLTILDEAIRREPRIWGNNDYPDLTKMKLWAK